MPGETTLNSLKTAAMSGVDVRLLLPHKSDSWLTHWCTRSYVEELLEAGVKIYWYQKGINHSKVIIVDGSVKVLSPLRVAAPLRCRVMFPCRASLQLHPT